MPSKYKRKHHPKWAEDDMAKAMLDVAAGVSIRSAARKHGMSEANLRRRLQQKRDGVKVSKQGRHPALDKSIEDQLTTWIKASCIAGFSPTVIEVQQLVSDHIRQSSLKKCFKNGKPGKGWLNGFMKRTNLSLKCYEVCSAGKSATGNAFMTFAFYDNLRSEIQSKNLTSSQIWRCDEIVFSTDPSEGSDARPKPEYDLFASSELGYENITTLAVCSASGEALAPAFIYRGKELQSQWCEIMKSLRGTYYSASETGKLTTDLFNDWFTFFAETVKQRPLVLVFSGNLTHISLNVIEKSLKENISIIKLPCFSSDQLKPFDLASFGPLTDLWNAQLLKWTDTHGPTPPISRATFAKLLAEIWLQGLSFDNVKHGFTCTGVYPVDEKKYPIHHPDPEIYRRYQAWLDAGRPENMDVDPGVRSSSSGHIRNTQSTSEVLDNPASESSMEPLQNDASSAPVAIAECPSCKALGPPPCLAPVGMMWVKEWQLRKVP